MPSPVVRPTILEVRTVTGTGGGPEKTILLGTRWLKAHGWPVQIIYLHPPADHAFEVISKRARELDVPLMDVEDRGPLDLRTVTRLFQIVRKLGNVIWHGHDYKADALGWFLHRTHRMKLLSTVHGWGVYAPRVRFYHFIHKLCLRGFDRVVCVSPSLREECIRSGIPPAICEILPNGVDCDEFAPPSSREEAKRSLGLPASDPVVGYVGRLSGEKDLATLFRGLARLIENRFSVHAIIVGDGPAGDELRSAVRELSLDQHVSLVGHAPDPRPYYAAMDVFVLPSLREGLPNVLLEAMAMALPVVATPVGGIPQLVRDGETGILIPPGDDRALAEAVKQLLADRSRAVTLGESARQHVKMHYSFDRRMERLEQILEGLLNRPTLPARPGM
ncbi:glycosyltransferase family 4 protein [Thermogutta sp.]|uniref:glycosyltransferase family 4 protein n=1 Tax=Thermogutta sp. TaxID=1962930 RepID=UPI003C7B67A3